MLIDVRERDTMTQTITTAQWPEAPEGGYFIVVDYETTVGHEQTLSGARARGQAFADMEILPASFSIINAEGEHVESIERSDGKSLQDQIAALGAGPLGQSR